MAYAVVGSTRATSLDVNVETETGTEIEGDFLPDPGLSKLVQLCSTRQCGRHVLGVAAVASALVLASSFDLARRSGATDKSDAMSLAASTEVVIHRTGCSNWRKILLKKFLNHSEADCNADCSYTPNCYSYNYQPGECGTKEAVTPMTCYLFSQGCSQEENTCWDLHISPGQPGWYIYKTRTGCGNWNDIKIGHAIRNTTAAACGLKCSENADCEHFNFQPGPCSGTEMVGEGSCYLFKGGCTEETNTCWDLYTMVRGATFWTTATRTDQGSTLIYVLDSSGFQAGNPIIIRHLDNTVQYAYVVHVLVGQNGLDVNEALVKPLLGGELIFVDTGRTNSPTTTAAGPLQKVSGILTFEADANSQQAQNAASKTLAAQLGVPKDRLAITVSAMRRRRLEEAASARRLVEKSWKVEYGFISSDAVEVNKVYFAAQDMANDPSIVEDDLRANLLAEGATSYVNGSVQATAPTLTKVDSILPSTTAATSFPESTSPDATSVAEPTTLATTAPAAPTTLATTTPEEATTVAKAKSR